MANKLLTINLRKYLIQQPRTKRAARGMRYVRERIAHYTKVSPENVRISAELNSMIFKHYSKRMVPLKMNVNVESGKATATPFAVQNRQEAQKTSSKKTEAKVEKPKAAPAAKAEAKK